MTKLYERCHNFCVTLCNSVWRGWGREWRRLRVITVFLRKKLKKSQIFITRLELYQPHDVSHKFWLGPHPFHIFPRLPGKYRDIKLNDVKRKTIIPYNGRTWIPSSSTSGPPREVRLELLHKIKLWKTHFSEILWIKKVKNYPISINKKKNQKKLNSIFTSP